MVGPIIHHKLQEKQNDIAAHLWRAWCCRVGDTIGWRGDLTLGEATHWCTIASVVWLVALTYSWPLLEWGYFVAFYQQWIVAENPSPAYVSAWTTPYPLDIQAHVSGYWWWKWWHKASHQQYASLCHSPCQFLNQIQNMHLIHKPSAQPPMTAWLRTHLCCECLWNSHHSLVSFFVFIMFSL